MEPHAQRDHCKQRGARTDHDDRQEARARLDHRGAALAIEPLLCVPEHTHRVLEVVDARLALHHHGTFAVEGESTRVGGGEHTFVVRENIGRLAREAHGPGMLLGVVPRLGPDVFEEDWQALLGFSIWSQEDGVAGDHEAANAALRFDELRHQLLRAFEHAGRVQRQLLRLGLVTLCSGEGGEQTQQDEAGDRDEDDGASQDAGGLHRGTVRETAVRRRPASSGRAHLVRLAPTDEIVVNVSNLEPEPLEVRTRQCGATTCCAVHCHRSAARNAVVLDTEPAQRDLQGAGHVVRCKLGGSAHVDPGAILSRRHGFRKADTDN